MRTFNAATTSDLFAFQKPDKQAAARGTKFDIGRVTSIGRNTECVPFTVGALRYMMEFRIPSYLTQPDFHDNIVLKTKSGERFVPKLEHRYLSLSAFVDDTQTLTLCQMRPADLPPKPAVLVDAIRHAVLAYYRSYPNANQFFYMRDDKAKPILDLTFRRIPAELRARYDYEIYTDLADPYTGFSITSKLL